MNFGRWLSVDAFEQEAWDARLVAFGLQVGAEFIGELCPCFGMVSTFKLGGNAFKGWWTSKDVEGIPSRTLEKICQLKTRAFRPIRARGGVVLWF